MSSIKVNKTIVTTADSRCELRVWVSETTENIPGCIFVYQSLPSVPLDNYLTDLFVHVASYADITDFEPVLEDLPGAVNDMPFYRKNYIQLVYDSKAELDTYWQIIKEHIQLLVEDIVKLNGLPAVEIIEVPG